MSTDPRTYHGIVSGFNPNFFLRKVVFVLLFIAVTIISRAQDPVFSQYYASALYLNPALAGVEPNWAVSMNYRNQWRSIVTPYTTSQVSFIKPFYSKSGLQRHWGGAGVSAFNDKAGAGQLMSSGANINLAYNVPISSLQNVIFALEGGFIYRSINYNGLNWGSQYDPNAPNGLNKSQSNPVATDQLLANRIMPDVGAGVLYYFNPGRDYDKKGFSAYAGFSAYHLNLPNESLIRGIPYQLPMLFKAHGGFEVNLSPKFNISPNVLFAWQNGVYQANVGSYLTYIFAEQNGSTLSPSSFILGGWYRLRDAAIISVGVANSFYTIGFSYDVNSSGLKYNTKGRGAYEISLKITKPSQKHRARFHTPRI